MLDSVLICGMGCVGKQILNTLIFRDNRIRTIGLLSTNDDKANGIILDWQQVLFSINPHLKLENAGKVTDLSAYSVCFLCVGLPESNDYASYVIDSLQVIENTVIKLKNKGFCGHLIIVSNPNDAATTYLSLTYKDVFKSIIGTSTNLDSFRLAYMLNEHSVSCDNAVVGKHGRLCVPIATTLSNQEQERLERMGEQIVLLKNHSEIGIAFSCFNIYQSIFEERDFIGAVYDEKYDCAFGWVLSSKGGKITKLDLQLSDSKINDLVKGISNIKNDVVSYMNYKKRLI